MLKKAFSKDQKSCKVTFRYTPDIEATSVHVCGDFNDWDTTAHPMKKSRDGEYSLSLKLDAGQKYCFRYLIDGVRWENDPSADAYEPNPFAGDNSIVSLIRESDQATTA